MNFWLTSKWPQLEDEPFHAPSGIVLRDEYKSIGSELRKGDRVLIFRTQTGKPVVKIGPNGDERVVRRRRGERGILVVAEVLGPLRESNSDPERYVDGKTMWWRWKVDTKVVSDSGFVPWQQVNRILGYKPAANMRGFGGGSGLKKISEEQYAQFVNLFYDSEKGSTTPDKSRFVIDDSGNRVAVILAIGDYEKLLEELEELECIRAYDAARTSGDEAIPFEKAIDEIERDKRMAIAFRFSGELSEN